MALTDENLRKALEEELNKAEETWKQVKPMLVEESIVKGFSVPSQIPGFPFLNCGKACVAEFIALVLDIRNSTIHLTVSERTAKVELLERVFYETTAVNTAGLMIIKEYKGNITEFLGDGFLALFKVNDTEKRTEVYNAYNAAKKCMESARSIINKILKERYSLPELEIGIGLAYSKAVVTIIGSENNPHPKAIGECVYRAHKLSNEYNAICVDERLKCFWPKRKEGLLRFSSLNSSNKFKGYKILKK